MHAGAAQVVLGDRPSQVTARRMGDAVLRGSAPLFVAACAASAAADYAAATGAVPGAPCSSRARRAEGSESLCTKILTRVPPCLHMTETLWPLIDVSLSRVRIT